MQAEVSLCEYVKIISSEELECLKYRKARRGENMGREYDTGK